MKENKSKQDMILMAEKLFAEKGFYAVTIRDITERTNCNVSSVNYHFGDKYGLLSAIFDYYFQKIANRFEESKIYQQNPAEMLKSINSFMQYDFKNFPTFMNLIHQAYLKNNDPKMKEIVKKLIKVYIAPLSERLLYASKNCQIKKTKFHPYFFFFFIVAMNGYWSVFSNNLVDIFDDIKSSNKLRQTVFDNTTKFINEMVENIK